MYTPFSIGLNLIWTKLIYVASILEYPDENTIKLLNAKIFKFLWNKRDRIKRNTLIGPIRDGGIKIVNIESKIKALKASWTKNYIIVKIVLRISSIDFVQNTR